MSTTYDAEVASMYDDLVAKGYDLRADDSGDWSLFADLTMLRMRRSLEWDEAVRHSHCLILGKCYYGLLWGKNAIKIFVSCSPLDKHSKVDAPDTYVVRTKEVGSAASPFNGGNEDLSYFANCFPAPLETFFSSNHLHVAAHLGRVAVETRNPNAILLLDSLYRLSKSR